MGQLVWLGPGWRFVMVGDERVDRWQELRELDVDGPYFASGMTARIWYQLVTEVEHSEMPSGIPRDLLREYVARYRPIPLPTLVREDVQSEP